MRAPLMARGFHGMILINNPPMEKQAEAPSIVRIPRRLRSGAEEETWEPRSDVFINDLSVFISDIATVEVYLHKMIRT